MPFYPGPVRQDQQQPSTLISKLVSGRVLQRSWWLSTPTQTPHLSTASLTTHRSLSLSVSHGWKTCIEYLNTILRLGWDTCSWHFHCGWCVLSTVYMLSFRCMWVHGFEKDRECTQHNRYCESLHMDVGQTGVGVPCSALPPCGTGRNCNQIDPVLWGYLKSGRMHYQNPTSGSKENWLSLMTRPNKKLKCQVPKPVSMNVSS